MAESIPENRPPVTLAERFDQYCIEIEQIVRRGIEHPRFELKREVAISRDNLADRLDFVKLVQGLANAHVPEEKFIVIGADQKERRFYNVQNASDFDPAKLSQVISKYLDPQPRVEVFNNARAQSGETYVIIVVNPTQPRPVIVVTEGQTEKKIHFRLGEIWIKKDTSLQLAVRADLDEMYETHIKRRVDEEAESRARRRFDHFREVFGASLVTPPISSAPSAELIVGGKGHLTKFAENLISTGNTTNLKMFLEMARQGLIEGWDSRPSDNAFAVVDVDAWIARRTESYKDNFIPALDSTVDMGLQVIRYDGSAEWFEFIMIGLIEAFEACRTLDLQGAHFLASRSGVAGFARPAYDVYTAIRALATYAVSRKRFSFLKGILPKFVRMFTPENRSQTYVPLTFWPFAGVAGFPDMRDGRNVSLWNAHIQGAWGQYFGIFDKFLAAASQLEFILEFNSYIFSPPVPQSEILQRALENKNFNYLPDFWNSRLDSVVPIADHFYDVLTMSGDFPAELSIEKSAIDAVLKGKNSDERLIFLGGFLVHLKSSQARMMMEQRRFPYLFDWEGRLKVIADKYSQTNKGK
jgi:hypothetical protein